MSRSGKKVETKEPGSAQVTPRDLDILRFVARHGVVSVHHVRESAFRTGGGQNGFEPASESAVYRRLRKLKRRGLIRHERILWNEPGIFRVTEAGARTTGTGLSPAGIDLADLEHDLKVVTLSLRVLKSVPFAARWITEREIRHSVLGRTRSAQTGLMRAGKGFGRIPDGLLVGLGGERVAIEVELSGKRDAAYRKIMDSYAAKHRAELPDELPHHYLHPEAHLQEYVESGGRIDGVAYYCASSAIRERVIAAQDSAAENNRSEPLAFRALDLEDSSPLRLDKHDELIRQRREEEERRSREEEEQRRAMQQRAEYEARLKCAQGQLTEKEKSKALREANRRAGRHANASVPSNEAGPAIISAAERKQAEQQPETPSFAKKLDGIFGGGRQG